MRKLVEFQILDSNATYYGMNLFDLMTNAGEVIADYIRNNHSKSEEIVFVCGSGNNGGDGYVASKLLSDEGFDLSLIHI